MVLKSPWSWRTRFSRPYCLENALLFSKLNGGSNEIPALTLAPELEQMLHQFFAGLVGADWCCIEPGSRNVYQTSLGRSLHKQQELAGEPAVLLTSGMLQTGFI